MAISQSEEARIAFYFRAQSLFEKSTFGPMLERADRVNYDSQKRKLAAPADNWHWRPDGADQQMQLAAKKGGEPSYEPDDRDLIAFAESSRRMLAVERKSRVAKVVLESYYGDRGARWAAFSGDTLDERGRVSRRGAGSGSIAALYMLTKLGQTFIAKERSRTAERDKQNGRESMHLTDDEVLANAFALEAAQPNPSRRATLAKVRDEAEALLVMAWEAWNATAELSRLKRTPMPERIAKAQSWHDAKEVGA